MINWKKVLETSLSVGVAIAASVIGDKFVAKAAKTIVSKDDEDNGEHTGVEAAEETEEVEETDKIVEDTED